MALVGINEVADMLGVSRTRADQLSRRPNFPSPRSAMRASASGKIRTSKPGWRRTAHLTLPSEASTGSQALRRIFELTQVAQ